LLVSKTGRRAIVEVHDLARRRVHAVENRPSTLLLDAKGRLWMGADHGEWGGWCRLLDLDTGSTRALATPPGGPPFEGGTEWQGVSGFVELPGGEIWAYGGTSHMGLREGYIVRVDEVKRLLTISGDRGRVGGPTPIPGQPHGPITMIAADPSAPDGGVLVLSYSDVYRADRALRRWRKIHTLHIRYRWGRPDAVGSYPSVRALHFIDGGDTMLLATRVDGFVRVRRDGREDQLAIPGQLEARSIDRVENTAAGQLFIEDDTSDVAWRLSDGGAWRTVDLAPPYDPHPLEVKTIPPAKDWYETKVLAGPRGDLVTINLAAMRPGTLTTAAWRGGRAVVLGREISDLFSRNTFVTPDGELWNLWYGDIKRFENGWWHRVGTYKAKPPEDAGIDIGVGLRALAAGGPPWIVFDSREGQLLTLDPGATPGAAHLAARVVKDAAGKPRRVHDAVAWRAGELLLATDAGLAVYAIASGKLGATPFSAPPLAVTRLYLDRKDRLWLGGARGLWMVEGRRGAPRSFDALPMIAGSTVEVIAADADPDGVVVSLGERGVVRLRPGHD
jgi:hypothetical protein